jgi:GR25 family glycosyltransferase involved in LPS biosynthesis
VRKHALEFLKMLLGSDQPERQTMVLDALVRQMSVRVRLRDQAWRGFFPDAIADDGSDEPDDAAARPNDGIISSDDWNWIHLEKSNNKDNAGPRTDTVQRYAALRAQQLLTLTQVPVWVLNLWRSPVRRLHMRREIEREGLQREAKLFHAVDGLALSDMTMERVIGKHAVLSTGEIGCFLTHLTAWREIERQALPFAVILEDDAQLKPGFRQKLYAMLHRLEAAGGAGWDVLFLEECSEMRAHGEPDLDCRKPYAARAHKVAGLLDIGAAEKEAAPMCVPSGVRAYAVSFRGAQRLAAAAVPIHWAIDVFMGEMIYERKVHAFCTVPSLARLHPGGAFRSDTKSVPVFHTKTEAGEVAYTADPRTGFPSCNSILCVLHFGLAPMAEEEEEQAA